MNLKDHIGDVPDFPKPGILFYDISPMLAHGPAWREAIDQLAALVAPYKPDVLAGIESRGFLVAAPLALKLGCGFVMLRKRGKLPGKTVSYSYDLEYGSDVIEAQVDAVRPGQRVVVLDDLLATGGTMNAAISLLRQMDAEVCAAAFLIELTFLNGRSRIAAPCHALMSYDS
ncbi:Adenine phosphoribosyltransferase [Azospirillaceae bacterium]